MKRIDYLEFASLIESLGITDGRFIGPLYSQLINADGFGGEGVEFTAAVIAGAQPKDQLMAMQAAQMAVIHCASMKYMRKVADWRESEKGDQQLAVNMATKLARTFSAQLDAMKRYRSGGEQNGPARVRTRQRDPGRTRGACGNASSDRRTATGNANHRPLGASAGSCPAPAKKRPAIIRVTQARCWRAGAVAPRRVPANRAWPRR